MKVMAIGSINSLTPEQKQQHLPTEVPATLKLYLDGKIEQHWFRPDPNAPGVIFLMNVESVSEAKTLVDALPLTVAKLMTFQLIELSPLLPLGALIQAG
ncbi:hypothetical protein [Ewingella americana]|jgi:hypothetical protein|uniref:hypothetical protein n=1 Tax=Ewingella americana TaxID=41202 RepID=UPI0012AE710A|nr:hypothetical protein [Ewingella americana]MRT03065.1 hypothetical protein [Ewingella americana]